MNERFTNQEAPSEVEVLDRNCKPPDCSTNCKITLLEEKCELHIEITQKKIS